MDNPNKYVNELFKIVSSSNILIIDKHYRVKRLYCPFQVKVRIELPNLKTGEIVSVEAVKITTSLREVYIIRSQPYYTIYFIIL